MSESRYQRVATLFVSTASLPEARRLEYLRRQCGEDADLYAEVLRLLRHKDDRDFLSEASLRTHRKKLETAFAPPESAATGDACSSRPARVGRYEVVDRIGAGGSGEVLRVKDPGGGADRALKVLHGMLGGRSSLRRFQREIDILRGLDHPGIVTILDFGHVSDPQTGFASPYFVMELVDGVPIDRFARDQALDYRSCVALIERICNAVAEAHRHEIHHRDLKPANVLVQSGGVPKILDFGSAAMRVQGDESQLTEPGHVIGTLDYMSPEQVSGDSHAAGAPADVYAIGVMLYEILAGRLPHDLTGLGLERKMQRRISEPPTPIEQVFPGCPRALSLLMARVLSRSPSKRPTDAGHLGAELNALLAGGSAAS